MNFIFISPQFPANYWNFCAQLKNNGVNVLGIGDTAYDLLSAHLKGVLTEYYRVDSMENYDQMMRAVAYFTFRYGKIDWIESNNEHWLEQDARLRTDFNIASGYSYEEMLQLKCKSHMKHFYQEAGVPVVECHVVQEEQGCYEFAERYGFPIIVKPDNGVGAQSTYKLSSQDDLKEFLETKPGNTSFIMEPFVDGTICSYDAIINSKGEPLFESGNVTPISIMDSVNNMTDAYFYIEKELPGDVRDAGRRCVRAFGIKSRFIHLEFFRLNRDMKGLGEQGAIIGLEANLRPCGGFTPDMLNYANSTNVYKIWADMIAFDRSTLTDYPQKYYCIYVGRRDHTQYQHPHTDVLSRYRANITMSDRMPDVLATAMGNQMYMAKFSEKGQMEEFLSYLLA